jgi:hypothetical protein
MGKNNKARRAAKAKQRRDDARTRAQRASFEPADAGYYHARMVRVAAQAALDQAAQFRAERLGRGVDQMIGRLRVIDREAVVEVAADELRGAVTTLWRNGWQPAEVVRQARRAGGSASAELMAIVAIAADHAERPSSTIDARWQQQIDAIGAGSACDTALPELISGAEVGSDWTERLRTVVDTLAALRVVPSLEELIPPPGGWTSRARASLRSTGRRASPALQDADVDRQLIDKVRNLLAKAESTEFDAEAEAFTDKAQELITRHAIDAALLAGDAAAKERPTTIRVAIDDPYADAKSLLLQTIAQANRCRVVYHASVSLSSVVGFEADVIATELLHTSLLVQAQSAMAAAARNAPPGARQRKASFKSAFLLAFSNRIGQRLADINAHLVGEAEAEGKSVLPVLRSRSAEVDDEFAERYPEIKSSRVRFGSDALGWATGRSAADHAKLNLADIAAEPSTERRPASEQLALPGR